MWARGWQGTCPCHPLTDSVWNRGLHTGSPIAQLCISSPQVPRTTVGSTGGNMVHFSMVFIHVIQRGGRDGIMLIWWIRPVSHVIYWLQKKTTLPRLQPPLPPGLNLVIYNIWDGRGFGLPQAIRDMQISIYELMLLTETNISYAFYCHNRLSYNSVCSQAVIATSRGAKGGLVMVMGERP